MEDCPHSNKNPVLVELEKKKFSSPEIQLISQMILRAWADFWSPVRLIQVDARNWLNFYDVDAFSFIWCCEALEYSPRAVRALIVSKPFTEHVQKLKPNRYKKVHCAS